MRDELLFVVVPRLAALCCLFAVAITYLVRRRRSDARRPAAGDGESSDALLRWWRCSIGMVLAGHVLALAFPGAVMFWNRQLLRLVAVECVGATAGTVALFSLLLISARQHRRTSMFEVIAATLIFLEVASGLAVALRYRWASSWAAVTLTPYVHSLLGFKPSVVLVARMPFLVQLHVFCAFAILAIAPFVGMAGSLIASVQEFARLASMPVLRLYRPAWRARRQVVGE